MDGGNENSSGIDAISTSSSIYATLPEVDAIRLLTLHPAPNNDMPLVGSLVVATLRDCRGDLINRYTALSYGITSNLATALRDIRHASESRTLWVDAVCINQGDLTERARQVRIIGEIYATAGSTIIYLGSPAPGLEVLFERVDARANVRLGICATAEVKDRQALVHAVEQICRYDWFGRSWVFQELIRSNDPRVHCGRMGARWAEIIYIISKTAQAGTLATSSRLVRAMDQTWGSRHPKDWTMVSLIHARAGSSATDPRDFFFSLMGLVHKQDEVRRYLQVDYNQSVHDVYVAAAAHALEVIGLLNLLRAHSSASTPNSPLREALPSWVPDWSVKTPWTPASAKAEAERSGGSAGSCFSWGTNPMFFRGRLTLPIIDWEWQEKMKNHIIPPDLDRIVEISATLLQGSEYPIAKFEKLQGGFKFQDLHQRRDVYYLRDGWVRPLGVVVLNHLPHDFSLLVPEKHVEAQEAHIRELYLGHSQDSNNSPFQYQPACRLALLANGYLHVVTNDAAVGDFVFEVIDLGQPAGPKFPDDLELACCVVGRPLRLPGSFDDDEEDEDAEIARHMAKVWAKKLQDARNQDSPEEHASLSGKDRHLNPRDANPYADPFAHVKHFRLVGISQAQPEYILRTKRIVRGVAVIH
ncbi:hypothetical protein PG993_012615 [Apiospora rasikravindrae]|uniref:Heterokaryon incompatibility domain-containing protein n=1 Tax=Apiospora rasikravindrae TaxID=990691 RepID=A0ABR1S2X8_9PEZI